MPPEQETILIVDDDQSIRGLMERIVTTAGFKVISASGGQEALDQVTRQHIDIVLLDMNMPRISGMEVLQQLSTQWPEICVIMVTGAADLQTGVKAIKLGAYDYVTKPFNNDALIFKIQMALVKRDRKLEDAHHQTEMQQQISEQTRQLYQDFTELVETLARDHKLIYRLTSNRQGGQAALAMLPKELQEPLASVDEFRNALMKILIRA